ncbi:MAG: alpha/beta fold hydrolase [Paracoccaceae bacterium]|nr:alpha/beta fold hydrolase [Paracoccaceae bacterium]
MTATARWAGRLGLALVAAVFLLFAVGPREPVDLTATFDPSVIGADPEAYLARQEARFDDITPGVEKRILWAGEPGGRTKTALVYLHGFSATSEEIRPVPDQVAESLGANLIFTRLAGHGRSGPAMASGTIAAWTRDLDEALALANLIGDRLVVIGTSTGATLLAAALAEGRGVDAAIFISPNFRIGNAAARILTWPAVRYWGPLVFGRERGFQALNPDHERYWTTSYPTTALFPMGALVAHARGADFSAVAAPALFYFSDADTVVDHETTREIAARWGGPSEIIAVDLMPGDDPFNHVLAGDILSPGMTDAVVEDLAGWISGV